LAPPGIGWPSTHWPKNYKRLNMTKASSNTDQDLIEATE